MTPKELYTFINRTTTPLTVKRTLKTSRTASYFVSMKLKRYRGDQVEKTFTPAEVATQLEISPSTLRKYSLLLQSEGITYKRNAKNSRRYSEADVMTLKRMINLVKSDGVTLDNAAYAVVRGDAATTIKTDESGVTCDGVERQHGDVSALLIGEVKALRKQIELQQKAIEGFQSAQEKRDSYFVEILENLQGEIKQLNEQAKLPELDLKENIPSVRKGFFGRLFK